MEQIFCEVEVAAARDVLYESCEALIGGKLERRDSNRRLVKEAENGDIVDGLYKLDGNKKN